MPQPETPAKTAYQTLIGAGIFMRFQVPSVALFRLGGLAVTVLFEPLPSIETSRTKQTVLVRAMVLTAANYVFVRHFLMSDD